jgi:hypothetical protein
VTDGDDGRTVTFPVAAFGPVAAILQCRRKRVLTEGQKAALAERGKASRFSRAGTQGEFPDAESTGQEETDPGRLAV